MTRAEFRKQDSKYRQQKITGYAQAYYDGDPVIDDTLFDQIYQDYLTDGGKPLGTGYGYKPVGQEVKHHCWPIGSLGKTKAESIGGEFEDDEIVEITPKLDGGSAVAYYEAGRLTRIVSRGDGTTGIDITANLAHAVPQSLPDASNVAVRGEIILTWEDFAELEGTHPRNKAVGLSQSIHVEREQVLKLKFVAYKILTIKNTTERVRKRLVQWGFTVTPAMFLPFQDFVEEVLEESSKWHDSKATFFMVDGDHIPYDGLVICGKSRTLKTKGADGWEYYDSEAVAFKFEDEEVETTVRDIRWELSRTNRLVPVAILEPVKLAGARIGRCTINNYEWATTNQVGVGARVRIRRANEVIPQITETLEPSNKLMVPNACPKCGTGLELVGVDLKCTSNTCENLRLGCVWRVFETYAPKGLATNTLERFLYEENMVILSTLRGYLLKYDTPVWVRLETRFGPHYAALLDQMFTAIKNAKPTVGQVLHFANIPLVGSQTCKAIERAVSPDDFMDLIREGDFSDLKQYCTEPGYKSLVECIYRIVDVVKFFSYIFADTSSRKVTVKYCSTGSLSKSRKKIEAEFEGFGCEATTIGNADVLICNAASSSTKYKAAVKKELPIMSEDAFRAKYIDA